MIHHFNSRQMVTVLFFSTFVLFFTLANSITAPLNHNEHMYISAIELLEKHEMYTEFSFLQMPLYPYFLYVATNIYKTNFGLFLPARIITGGLFFISCLLIFVGSKKFTKSSAIACVVVLFFASMPMIQASFQEASNYGLAITLSLVFVYLLITLSTDNRKIIWFLLGLVAGLMVNVKLYYLVLLVFVPIAPLLFDQKKYLNSLILASLGLGVGAIPALFFMLKDLGSFVFNNVTYHKLNTIYWMEKIEGPFVLTHTIFEKVVLICGLILTPPVFIALVLLCIWIYSTHKFSRVQVVLVSMGVAGLVTCFAITPMHIQYLALPFTFLSVLIVFPLKLIKEVSKSEVAVVAIGMIFLVFNASTMMTTVMNKDTFTPLFIYQGIRSLDLGISNSNMKAATLSPIFAIEAGLDTYNQFSTGPFNYRLGDLHQKADIERPPPITFLEIENFLNNEKPPLIIVGGEEEYDQSFLRFAHDNRYLLKAEVQGVQYYVSPLLGSSGTSATSINDEPKGNEIGRSK